MNQKEIKKQSLNKLPKSMQTTPAKEGTRKEQVKLILRFLEKGFNSVSPFQYRKFGLNPAKYAGDGTESVFRRKAAKVLRKLLARYL